MVTDFRAIGKHYTSFMFWMDLLFWFPFVSVILTAWPELAEGPECELEIPHCGLSVGYYVGLLGFLKASGTNCQGATCRDVMHTSRQSRSHTRVNQNMMGAFSVMGETVVLHSRSCHTVTSGRLGSAPPCTRKL